MGFSLVHKLAPPSDFWVSLTQFRRKHRALPSNVILKDRVHRRDERRLRLPEPALPYEGLYYVQKFGKACPQQYLTLPNAMDSELRDNVNKVVARFYDRLMATDEDCKDHAILPNGRELTDSRGLTINVVTPAGATPRSGLPVIVVCIFALTSRHDVSPILLISGFMVVASKLVEPPRLSLSALLQPRLVNGSPDTMAVLLFLGLLILANPSFSLA
jgi:hypothetical protein